MSAMYRCWTNPRRWPPSTIFWRDSDAHSATSLSGPAAGLRHGGSTDTAGARSRHRPAAENRDGCPPRDGGGGQPAGGAGRDRTQERKKVVEGKRVAERVEAGGGRRNNKKKKKKQQL